MLQFCYHVGCRQACYELVITMLVVDKHVVTMLVEDKHVITMLVEDQLLQPCMILFLHRTTTGYC